MALWWQKVIFLADDQRMANSQSAVKAIVTDTWAQVNFFLWTVPIKKFPLKEKFPLSNKVK